MKDNNKSAESGTFSPPQIARRYRVNVSKVLNWIRKGELVAMNLACDVGGMRPRYRIDARELAAFELRRTVAPAPTPVRRRRRDRAIKQYV